jgi:hypothetical protein
MRVRAVFRDLAMGLLAILLVLLAIESILRAAYFV